MNKKTSLACAGAVCLLLSGPAAAQPPVERNLPLWEIGVGAAALSLPAYPGADSRSSRVLPVPLLLYRGKVLRADQSGINARLLNTDRAEFDIGFAGALPASSDDVDERAGMPDLGALVEFGPRLKLRLADIGAASRLRLELPLRAVIEARGGLHHQGYTLEPRLVAETRGEDGLWSYELQFGAVFGDRSINRYFYEVRPEFATPQRPVYSADAGLMLVRTGLFASRRIHPDLRLFGFVRYETYGGAANGDSPLMKKNTSASAGLGFTWTFARSKARASD